MDLNALCVHALQVTKEQVTDYATRKKMPVDDAERWLRTMLNYEP